MFSELVPDAEYSTWWVVFCNKMPVAYAGMQEHTSKYVYLNRVGVLPDYRGYGLQRKLVRKRVNHAKGLDYKGVVTYTLFDNTHSANNLIKEGFLLFDPLEPWADEDSEVLYWIKDVQ